MDEFFNLPENEQEGKAEPVGSDITNPIANEQEQCATVDEAAAATEADAKENPTEEGAPISHSFQEYTPVYNPINYTPVNEINDYKPMSKGLRVFTIIIAAVILATGSCVSGYFWGKISVKSSAKYIPSAVELESAPKEKDHMTAAQVYKSVNQSIVGIVAYNSEGKAAQASGVVFSKNGHIITNDHIYADIPSAKFKIFTFDGQEYDASFVAGDVVSDLAILKTDAKGLTAAKFGNSDELFQGQNVAAIGRPGDATASSSITTGIVSAINIRAQITSNYSARLIQTSSAINPGSSGGALVNMYGQVVGITSSKPASETIEDVGYAIPTTVMKRVADELISHGKVVSRAKLGITYTAINSVTAEINNYQHTGLYIASVSEDSGLYGKAGEGDIITHINGEKIFNDSIVLDIIEKSRAGDVISLSIVTKNGTVNVDAELKANVGESSYKEKSEKTDGGYGQGGTFNFPNGD